MSKKILIKLSGEALADNENNKIFQSATLFSVCSQIETLVKRGYLVGVVIGGGNIWRGKLHDELKINQKSADYMGMLSTVINSIAIANMLRDNYNLKVNLINSLKVLIPDNYIEYDSENIEEKFKKGFVNVFSGGTGKPFFSTDTSVSEKAISAKIDTVLIAKFGTDGIYDKDPNKFKTAKFIEKISYKEVLDNKEIKIMDRSALDLLKNSKIKLYIFDMAKENSIISALEDKKFKKTIVY